MHHAFRLYIAAKSFALLHKDINLKEVIQIDYKASWLKYFK
jgi:hypothetical protein